MSVLRDLDDGFGDDNTFVMALLGLRALLDDVVESVAVDSEHPAEPSPPDDIEPERSRFVHLLLGIVAVQELLDELCAAKTDDHGPDDPDESGLSSTVRDLLR